MIINVPIESLEERYSAQWNKWFPREFQANGLEVEKDYITIYPDPITHKIRQGSFLDIIGTNLFKAAQLREICRLIDKGVIRDKDTFLFHDLWFPGIEMLAYIRDALRLDINICGILHAGTYDEHDFLHRMGMDYWASHIEKGWTTLVDKIFVATDFHKRLLMEKREVLSHKIAVTGLPIYPEWLVDTHKMNMIVFPHRLDPEKEPSYFDALEKTIKPIFPHYDFVKTKLICNTKEKYYDILQASKIAVSFSRQETWGIAMQESVMSGCIPLVPNRLSYEELYPRPFRFKTFDECVDKIINILRDEKQEKYFRKYLNKLQNKMILDGSQAIKNMLDCIKAL